MNHNYIILLYLYISHEPCTVLLRCNSVQLYNKKFFNKFKESQYCCTSNFVCYIMDEHLACLRQLCRVCGIRFGRDDRRYACSEYSRRLSQVYSNLHLENDDPLLHPTDFCIGFYPATSKCEKSQGALLTVAQSPQWQAHSEDCPICSSCKEQRKGGRPSKKLQKKRTAAASDTMPSLQNVIDHIKQTAPPSLCSDVSTQSLLLSELIQPALPLTIALLLCPIYKQIMWNYLLNNYAVHSVLLKPVNHQLILSVLCANNQSQVQTLYSVHKKLP